jgi:hypothetical protein
MADSMLSSIQNEIGVLNGTEAAAKINAAAAASNKTGFGGIGGGANSQVKSNTENNVNNVTKTVIENIFQKNLTNNFSSKTVDECIGKTTQKNEIGASVGGDVHGGAKVECNQSNTLEQVTECKQMTEAISKTISKTAQELGFKITNENENKSDSEDSGSAKSENVTTGPIQDLGNALSSIFGAALVAELGPVVICVILSCCCCLSLIILIMVMKSGGSSDSEIPRAHQGHRGGNLSTSDYLTISSINFLTEFLSDTSDF